MRWPASIPMSVAAAVIAVVGIGMAHGSVTHPRPAHASRDSVVVRWPDQRVHDLRVWVEGTCDVSGWNAAYTQMAREAFAAWTTAGLPIQLDFVSDSAGSDIQINWIDRFPPELGPRIGATTRFNDQNGWLLGARVRVALHDAKGRTFSPAELSAIVVHEAGHALGLGHSSDPLTIMYPLQTSRDITDADRATLKQLYSLTPGPVR